jgi:hypothetical protein
MFHAQMAAAIADARTLAQANDLSRKIWQAHAAETVSDDEAQALAEALHARRREVRETIVPVGIPLGRATLFPPKRRHPVSPDRLASRDRRRLVAASGPMPPALARRFTTGQLAVLGIIGDEVERNGACGLCIDAIAARAGVCRRLAQAAIRLAEGDGLLTIQERRHQGRRNDPNVIRLLSREWLAWLKRRTASRTAVARGGCKPLHPTDSLATNQGSLRAWESRGKGCRGAENPVGTRSIRDSDAQEGRQPPAAGFRRHR